MHQMILPSPLPTTESETEPLVYSPLWHSTAECDAAPSAQVDRLWQMFLHCYDMENTFRFLKQTLGWTTPRVRDPQAADRWSWLVLVAYTQLRAKIVEPYLSEQLCPSRVYPVIGVSGVVDQ
jgi:hypothetical protein